MIILNCFLETQYTISVKTGDLRSCGTDANVFLKIFGELGNTEELALKDSSTNKDKFERGKTDVFQFNMLGLGKWKTVLESGRLKNDEFQRLVNMFYVVFNAIIMERLLYYQVPRKSLKGCNLINSGIFQVTSFILSDLEIDITHNVPY